ncbi:hypothetical protein F0L17_08240 [Streptomyces sp. TRM43335]|uniref:DUF6545 domain-containing protein n=1 Tax=Streptomyces taklimakanensis TaxID=2569853 RepID=A0A6G2BA27_9ACTN|nr:MAB_1171c family putative transporter [Streptomyces taklimakanensis]MTE19117.1 hypothetical protein [Streptomyces taklimakanensis]
MSDQSAIQALCSAVGWVAFAVKLRDLRRAPRNPMRRAICSTLFLASACVLFGAPAVIDRVNDLTGVPNFSAPLVYCLLVALGASCHVLLAYWRQPAEEAKAVARRWTLGYAAVVVALIALFTVGEAPDERLADFDTHYATTPYIAQFVVLYLLALFVAMAALVHTCWGWAKVAGRPWLRRGLRLIALGSLGALGFSVAKLVAVVARWVGVDWSELDSALAPALAMVGLVVSAVGYALPVLGDHLSQLGDLAGRRRAYRALYPLWDALRRATPAIVPSTPVPWWDFELRLTRRLAEINDGRLALRSHTDPEVAKAAERLAREAGLEGVELHAVVDAARLRAAIAAKAADIRFPQETADAPYGGPRGGTDGIGELAWLVGVSRAFASSPLVAAAVARADVPRAAEADGAPGASHERRDGDAAVGGEGLDRAARPPDSPRPARD